MSKGKGLHDMKEVSRGQGYWDVGSRLQVGLGPVGLRLSVRVTQLSVRKQKNAHVLLHWLKQLSMRVNFT